MAQNRTRSEQDSLSAATTPQNYPTHQRGKNKLRKLLSSTSDPTATISQFQKSNSLHTYLAKAFGTIPDSRHAHSSSSRKSSRTTRNDVESQKSNEKLGVIVEPFQPESVLTFCGHCDVSRYEMHKTIADALRNELENEIERVDLKRPNGKTSLLELLKNSWQFINVPELRGVFVNLMKKLGDEVPVEVLAVLASKSPANEKESKKVAGTSSDCRGGNTLKYGDLLNSFGPDIKRLVWEADWTNAIRGDGVPLEPQNSSTRTSVENIGTMQGENILIDMIRPAVQEYLLDQNLMKAADLTFTSSIREKRIDTKKRRHVHLASGDASETGTSLAGTLSLTALTKASGKNNLEASIPSQNDVEKRRKNGTGMALSNLKEIMGSRPKLLSAVLNVLVAEHGRHAHETKHHNGTAMSVHILGGSKFLHCTLLSDILLSYGQLPRQYEHVRLLAQTLDNCVRIGIISDQAVAQIQSCLKSIFQPDQDKEILSTTPTSSIDQKEITQNGKAPSKNKNKSKTSELVNNDSSERQFELKLLRKIIKASVATMKEGDPQGLFLNPVTDELAPGYSKVIKRPMCLRTIEEKAINLRYASLVQYESDVQLMFQNCITYNIGKEGQWFRNEAKRQQKKWRESKSDVKEVYRTETRKRKKQLENAVNASSAPAPVDKKAIEEKKRREILLAQQRHLSKIGTKKNGEKRKLDAIVDKNVTGSNEATKKVEPLSESRAKKRKKDSSFPSMPALASMLLCDPFVLRLLLDKVLRNLGNDVMKNKTVPSGHAFLPSILQLLHIATFSTRLCAMKGKIFVVPDAGLTMRHSDKDSEVNISESYTVLRQQIPMLAKLLLEADLDKRTSPGGDLQALSSMPKRSQDGWEDVPHSSLRVLLDLVQGSLVYLLQPGVSNELALLSQCPRFFDAINTLSHGDMTNERCFFASLIHALLRYKRNLPQSVRDLFINVWLGWFKSSSNTLTGAVHLYFITLLNEVR